MRTVSPLMFFCYVAAAWNVLVGQPSAAVAGTMTLNKSSCQQVISKTLELPPDPAAQLLHMIQIAIQPGNGMTSEILRSLSLAAQSTTAFNPFLNSSSALCKALAIKTESLIREMKPGDWDAIRTAIQKHLSDYDKDTIRKSIDSEKTSAVGFFTFLSFEDLYEAAQPGLLESSFVRAMSLGQTSTGHYIVSFQSQRYKNLAIASISMRSGFDRQPVVTWMTRGLINKNSSANPDLSPDQQILTHANQNKVWIINGKLYVVLILRPGSEALVELDPGTGAIIERFDFSDRGRIAFYNLADQKIAVLRFVSDPLNKGGYVANEVFQLDMKAKGLLKADVDVSHLQLSLSSIEASRDYNFLTAVFDQYRFDLQQLYRREDPKESDDVPYWASSHVWSLAETMRPESATVDVENYNRMYIRTNYLPVLKESVNSASAGTSPQERILSLEQNHEISKLPEITGAKDADYKMIRLPPNRSTISLDSIGQIWWVERSSLQAHKIKIPDAVRVRTEQGIDSPFESWEVRVNSQGQHILLGYSPVSAKYVAWMFNPARLHFEDPKVGPLPEDTTSKGFFLSPDKRKVVGKITEHGIWVLIDQALRREVAE